MHNPLPIAQACTGNGSNQPKVSVVHGVALEGEVARLGQAVAAAKAEYDLAAVRLEELRQRLKECDHEIGALLAEKGSLVQQITDLTVEKKRLQHK